MGQRVSLFVTCIVDQLFPKVGMAMADVLERARLQRRFSRRPDLLRPARVQQRLSRRSRAPWPATFSKVFEDAEYIVVPSGSCTSMISHHFDEIFHEDARNCARAPTRSSRASRSFPDSCTEVAQGGRRGRALRRRRHLSRQLPRAARIRASRTVRAGCSPRCAASNCAKWTSPRSAADSAARSR